MGQAWWDAGVVQVNPEAEVDFLSLSVQSQCVHHSKSWSLKMKYELEASKIVAISHTHS